MADRVIIERLEFQGRCGVTQEERQAPQPIAVDLDLDYPPEALSQAAATDSLIEAVDYAKVAERIIEIGTTQEFSLVETLAERLAGAILGGFPITGLKLWVRKVAPPLKHIQGSVGVKLERTQAPPTVRQGSPQAICPPPARFLQEQLHVLPKGRALDVATGQGRNALYLASHGYHVEGMDRDERALAQLAARAKERNLTNVTLHKVDLEAEPNRLPDLPKEHYDVILVFFYLHRPLFPGLLQALKPGGMLLYETFLIDNHLRHRRPRWKEFCLGHNELLRLAKDLRVLHYDEGAREEGHGSRPVFTARLLAVKEP
ncbi:MAG: dihydroneopterin aldolase [Nitrospirae bacterium]|nr:dihydroneopterin aldolase [Nitrospirota bacterium]